MDTPAQRAGVIALTTWRGYAPAFRARSAPRGRSDWPGCCAPSPTGNPRIGAGSGTGVTGCAEPVTPRHTGPFPQLSNRPDGVTGRPVTGRIVITSDRWSVHDLARVRASGHTRVRGRTWTTTVRDQSGKAVMPCGGVMCGDGWENSGVLGNGNLGSGHYGSPTSCRTTEREPTEALQKLRTPPRGSQQ